MTPASVALANTVIKRPVDFWTVTILLALLFGLFGFVQGPGKAALNSAGIFLAYGTAIKTADFIRKAFNFVLGTNWDEGTLPLIKFAIFLVAFLIMFAFVRYVANAKDRFSAKVVGFAIGGMNGTIFSTLMLEFMAKYWKLHPPQADLNLDLSWFLRINPSTTGKLQVNLHFINNPEKVYQTLNRDLKFLLFAVLFLAVPPVFKGVLASLKRATQPILNFLGLSEATE